MASNIQNKPARELELQVVHYLRIKVNFNDAGISAGVAKQWLPQGAIIIGTDVHVATAFNGTTPVLTIGTNATAYDNIVGATFAEGASGLTQNIAPTGTALGPLAADVRVFAKFTATTPTTGVATFIVRFVVDNDL